MNFLKKHKSILIVSIFDGVLLIYLVTLLLGLFKVVGTPDEWKIYNYHQYSITNEVINDESSLDSENRFVYQSTDDLGNERTITFYSNKNENNSLGTYDPHSYIFGTEDLELYINFYTPISDIVRFNEICMCDIDGQNIKRLEKSDYNVAKSSQGYTLKYVSGSAKYVYSVSLTYLVKKN